MLHYYDTGQSDVRYIMYPKGQQHLCLVISLESKTKDGSVLSDPMCPA